MQHHVNFALSLLLLHPLLQFQSLLFHDLMDQIQEAMPIADLQVLIMYN